MSSSFKKIHIIGIGGAGMSALAEFLCDAGYTVSGSDILKSDNSSRLEKRGIKISYEHRKENISDADFVVYSAAISDDNAELAQARESCPTLSRAQMLFEITNSFETVAAISGSHGKTTASAMLTKILICAAKNPSSLLGGVLPCTGTAGMLREQTLVVEACEFKETFLSLKRDLSVILNIDNDHLECYGSFDSLKNAFCNFAAGAKTAIAFGGDKNALFAAKHAENYCTFGWDASNDYYADNIECEAGRYSFTIVKGQYPLCRVSLNTAGKHNILNALAAAACADILGVSANDIQTGLNTFEGVARRFEILGMRRGVTLADDYAHHPVEIEALIKTAREMCFEKITLIFQPFTFSRTALLFDDFVRVLGLADRCIICDIMGSRETEDYGVNSKMLCEKIHNSVYAPDFETAAKNACEKAVSGELILTVGCGDVYKCARRLLYLL